MYENSVGKNKSNVFAEKGMPIFIDSHKLKDLTEEKLQKIATKPADKHGVKHIELLFNKKEDKLFCVLEAPNAQSVKKHHEDTGISCDFIFETTRVKPDSGEKTQRLQVMGELSARVAHDLRNPLGVIKNAIELMEMTTPAEKKDEKMKKRISMIKNASDRMLRQINDVLDFVRTRPLEIKRHSLLDIINSSIKFSIPSGIKLTKPKNDVEILCDNKQLEVVFSNLISNAIDAIENKGKVEIRIKEKPSKVIVEVQDSGPGIPPEHRQKIFDPLFTSKPRGTGLGLVSCKNIVEQHGGKISFKNSPTVFSVELPKKA